MRKQGKQGQHSSFPAVSNLDCVDCGDDGEVTVWCLGSGGGDGMGYRVSMSILASHSGKSFSVDSTEDV